MYLLNFDKILLTIIFFSRLEMPSKGAIWFTTFSNNEEKFSVFLSLW